MEIHDYTEGTYTSGWALIHFQIIDKDNVWIEAFGLHREREGKLADKYFQVGEFLAVMLPDGEVLYEITEIDYCNDPYDLFYGRIKYVQHLTGMSSIYWGERYKDKQEIVKNWSRREKVTKN